MNVDFWKGKRVLVTGSTGFKGQWLVKWLEYLGASVDGFGLPNDIITVDLLDYLSGVDIVFHLAAQAIVSEGYKEPFDTFETNVLGTARLYDEIRQMDNPPKVIVTVTSDKCYLNHNNGEPFCEADALGGNDPYSASKACQEIVSNAYRESFFKAKGIQLATARAGNVIGGGDMAVNRLFPDCVRAKAEGKPVTIRHPFYTRPFQYVLDALHGYLLLAEKMWEEPIYDGAWNFGPDDSTTVIDAVSSFNAIYGGDFYVSEAEAPFKEAKALALNSSMAREELGWKPMLPVMEAIVQTAYDYRDWSEETRYKRIVDFTHMVNNGN